MWGAGAADGSDSAFMLSDASSFDGDVVPSSILVVQGSTAGLEGIAVDSNGIGSAVPCVPSGRPIIRRGEEGRPDRLGCPGKCKPPGLPSAPA